MAVAARVAITGSGATVPLPSFKFDNMPVGLVVCDTTGQNWQLTATTAAVDHTTYEAVAGNPNLRWKTYTAGGGGLPGGTGLVQTTGGVGSVATAANLITAQQLASPLTNETITAGSNVQDFVLAPAGWTLNGDTDGNYIITGILLVASGGVGLSFQPNASAANQHGEAIYGAASGTANCAPQTTFFLANGGTNASRVAFEIRFSAKSGVRRRYWCDASVFDPTAVASSKYITTGEWDDTATVVGPTTQIHCSVASGILTGSFANVKRDLQTH